MLTANIKKKLDNIVLDIDFYSKNNKIAVLGVNGAGKSMFLKCLAGLESPDSGTIILNGRVLFDSKLKINIAPQERKIAYLFQNFGLFPHMTIYENIKISSQNTDYNKIDELIKLFNLEGLEKRYPKHISGGQQQRVALARIFAYDPDVILLDEPFSNLDINLKRTLETNILYYLEKLDKDVIIVTHNYQEAFNLCEKTMIIDNGKSLDLPQCNEIIFKKPRFIETAILFNCNNFSEITIINEYEIYAINWNITIKLNNKIDGHYTHIGIYNHDFILESTYNSYDIINTELINCIENYKLIFAFNKKSDKIIIPITNHEAINISNKIAINTDNILFLNNKPI